MNHWYVSRVKTYFFSNYWGHKNDCMAQKDFLEFFFSWSQIFQNFDRHSRKMPQKLASSI